MSDVSGIPNMGFGGGNFFAPSFSYNPQINPTAGYAGPANYAQNVQDATVRDLQYDQRLFQHYYEQSLFGVANMPAPSAPGTFTDYNAGGDWPSRGGDSGGGGGPTYGTLGGDAFGSGGLFGGSGGFSPSGGIYGGFSPSGGIYGGDSFGGMGGGRQDPYPGMSMPGGLGMPASSPSGAGAIDWSRLFGGEGGPRNDPAPDMAMPGGLNAPMSMPQTQQQPGINWGNVGAAAGSSAPYTSGIEPDQTGGQTLAGGAAASDPYPGMAVPGGLGSPMSTPQAPATVSDATTGSRTYDFKPMFEGGGGGGFGSGGTESQTYGAPAAGSLGGNIFDYTRDPNATKDTPGPSAEALAERARARLAEVIAKPQIPTTDESAPSAASFDERFKGDATAQGAGSDLGNAPAMPDMQKLLGYTPQEFTPEQPAIDWSNFPSPANDYNTFQAGGGTAGPSPFDQPSLEEFQKGQTGPSDKIDTSMAGRKEALDTLRKELQASDLVMTSSYRDPSDPLSKANPRSAHTQALAFDTRARTPEQADAAIGKIRELMNARGMVEGRDYKILDEVRSPSGHATGPHIHTTLTPEGMERYQRSAYDTEAPRPPADIPYPQGIPLPTERPAEAGPSAVRDPNAPPRPPVDIPDFPARRLAPNGQEPAAFVVHHTEGRPTLESTVADWKTQTRVSNLGSQYFLDRDGVIHDVKAETGYPGTNQTRTGNIQGAKDLNNSNVVGIEVSAKNTADMTPAQRAVLQQFVEQHYSQTPVYGHAEIDSGKDPDEGVARASEILDARVAANPNMFPSPGFWDQLDAQKAGGGAVPLPTPRPEGADVPRPPADVPSGTPFVNDGTPFGPPVPPDYKPPAAAPVKHSGLELARANIDTPIEKIAMERGGQKAVDQVSSMAIGQTPRQLMQSYGGLFMSKAEPLFASLGITRSDFEKAITMSPTRQDLKMRFGEMPEGQGFGPYPAYTGPEAAPGGGGYADFRRSENVEDRRNELASLQPGGFGYAPGPEVDPTILGVALGLRNLPAAAQDNAPISGAAAESSETSMRDFPSPANDYSAFQQPASRAEGITPQSARDALANIVSAPPGKIKTMDFSGGFSRSPEPRQGGVGPPVELTPEFMDVIQEVESSGDPNQVTGSYKGLYQLDDKEFRKYGGQGDIFDPEQNTKAAAAKMTDETQRVQDRLGRALTPPEQYMVHNQGVAGSLAHLANPDELAWKNFQGASGRSDASAKEAIWKNMTPEMKKEFGNDVNNVTSRDFLRLWEDRYYGILNR